MAEKIFSPKERGLIEALAQRRGFKSVREYMRALVTQDAQQHGELFALDEPSTDEIREGIKQGLREALRGEYVPLDSLWTDDDE